MKYWGAKTTILYSPDAELVVGENKIREFVVEGQSILLKLLASLTKKLKKRTKKVFSDV